MKSKTRRSVNKNNTVLQNVKGVSDVKAVPSEEIIIQYDEKEVAVAEISEKIRQDYKNSGIEEEMKDVKIYVKPQDNKAYYVINGAAEGSVDLV